MRLDRRHLLRGVGASTATASWPALAQDAARSRTIDRPYRIFMITWRGWEDGSQGFEDYLTRNGLPVELIKRDAERSADRVKEHVREAKSLKPDLVYTWGTTTALNTFGRLGEVDQTEHITDIPGVFNIVSTPVRSGLVEAFDRPRTNLTGTLYLVPIDTQLRTIQNYDDITKLGIVFNAKESNSRLTANRIEEIMSARGIDVALKPVPLDADEQPSIEAIPELVRQVKDEGCNWLYIPPDSFLNVNRDALTMAAKLQQLPSFAAAENFIRQAHALVGLVSRYYNVGQYAGYLAEQILVEGVSPASIPLRNLDRFSLLVNRDTAPGTELLSTPFDARDCGFRLTIVVIMKGRHAPATRYRPLDCYPGRRADRHVCATVHPASPHQ